MTGVEDLALNRALWDVVNEQFSGAEGAALWRREDIVWGIFGIPEAELGVLGDVAGLDVIELGCGAAHVSAWLARRGARVVALDLSGGQLRSAAQAQAEHGLRFGLIQANGEQVPLASGCADLVVSEHGAPAWCEPDAWIGEAARLLRPGGRLVFLTNSPLSAMCVPADGGPAGERLLRGPAELSQVRWPGGGVEHHLGHGAWIETLLRHGFAIEGLRELHAPAMGPAPATDAQGSGTAASDYYGIAEREWGMRWPVEDLWVARLLVRAG